MGLPMQGDCAGRCDESTDRIFQPCEVMIAASSSVPIFLSQARIKESVTPPLSVRGSSEGYLINAKALKKALHQLIPS